jgi:hypothetical protein
VEITPGFRNFIFEDEIAVAQLKGDQRKLMRSPGNEGQRDDDIIIAEVSDIANEQGAASEWEGLQNDWGSTLSKGKSHAQLEQNQTSEYLLRGREYMFHLGC